MIRAKLSPKAVRDLNDIFDLICADNPDAAHKVRHAILGIADFLAQHPELGQRILRSAARHSRVRWFVAPKFRNYLIFYQPFQETVIVVRVLHAAQDWRRFFPSG